MAAQQDWISDAWRQKARQQMEDAFSRCSNPYPKSVEEIEKTVYEQWHNAKEKYSAAIQIIVRTAVQAHRQQQLQNMGSQQVMMRPPMQPSQPGQQMGAPQMQSGMQQLRQFGNPSMSRGPPSDPPQNISMQSPLSSGGIGYSPDNRMPNPSPGSQYYQHRPMMQRPPQPQQAQQQEKNSKDLSKRKRFTMGTLLKGEKVSKNCLDEPPKTWPQDAQGDPRYIGQPFLDDDDYAVASDIKLPMIKHTLKRTFGPALQALNGGYYRPETSLPKRLRIRKPSDGENSKPGISVPNDVQGGIARLESQLRSDSESGQNLEEERLRLVEGLQSYAEVTKYLPQEISIRFKKLTLGEYQPTLTELKAFEEEFLRIAQHHLSPKNLRIEKNKGKLIVRWDQPPFILPLKYSGCCVGEDELNGKKVVHRFENIGESYHELQNFSPIRCYRATVHSIVGNGLESSSKTSERVRPCKDLGHVFINESAKLRPGDEYSVYKGYMRSVPPYLEKVAVKIVPGENFREVEMMQELDDNNIVTYRASGMVKEGMYVGKAMYIAMELCETETFWELISEKKLNAIECKLALLHVMHGLATIHEKDILHRDLKPQNILRSRDGRNIKIADFGISKKAKAYKSKVTKSVMEIGTEGWGSPEHYSVGTKMSTKSDIYSAGLVFAFALSGGKHAHGEEAHAWKTRIITGEPKYDLSILSCEDVKIAEDIIEKMLERRPEDRPTTGDVLTHPFFWDSLKKLQFLHQMSSFFEQFNRKTDRKVPVAASNAIITNVNRQWHIIRTKQQEDDWFKKMKEMKGAEQRHSFLINNKANEQIGKKNKKKPKYDHSSVTDLIRFIRNIEEHYRDHEELIQEFGDSKENIWKFFSECFPDLLCTVLDAVRKSWPEMKGNDQFPADAKRFFIGRALYQPLISTGRKPARECASLCHEFAPLEA